MMKTATKNFAHFLRTYAAIGAAIAVLAIIQTEIQTQALLKFRTRYKWVILIAVFAINAALGLFVALRGERAAPLWPRFEPSKRAGALAKLAGAVLLVAPLPLFLYARSDFFGHGSEAFFRLLWLFWWIAFAQAIGLRLATGLDWIAAISLVLLLDGIAAQLYTLSTVVSAYPFSLGWSEASRYYYGSLVFSKFIYGEAVPLSVMHGTRYLLQGLAFLVDGIPLWGARLWQSLLWFGLTALSAWALIRRLAIPARLWVVLAIAWLFLYYFQGAVYYHLQVPVIIILLAVAPAKPWRSLAAIVVASIWAGMSRVNWFPVPAMLAIALYILETPLRGVKNVWTYARMPLYFGLTGLASAFAGQGLYIAVSGNTDLEAFASSFSSALLWYRWFPSPTNPIGIIPGVILISIPLAAAIAWRHRSDPGEWHPLRAAALGIMLMILLAGGLVVSTKIGGGGDLHNMDAYMVLLAILGAYAIWGSVATDGGRPHGLAIVPGGFLMLLTIVPVGFALLRFGNPFVYDRALAQGDLAMVRQEVLDRSKSGEVLFMYERHLLTFDMISSVKLVPEYEVLTLMEMAISGNEEYLAGYYEDLGNHRFSAIVAHPQNLGVETGDFIEENNAWTHLVGQPLLCQYKPALTLDYSNVQILVPRERPCPEFPPSFGTQ